MDNFVACPQRFLWHPPTRTAILADLHLGAEVQLAQQGLYLPDLTTRWLEPAWSALVLRLAAGPSRLIVAGDLFDAAEPDAAAIETAQRLLELLPAATQVLVIPGNHDPAAERLQALLGSRVQVVGSAEVGGYSVVHGHEPALPEAGRGWIVGHQHPSVVLADRVRSAKMTCFAVCELRGPSRKVILLPAFSRTVLGIDMAVARNWILSFARPSAAHIRIAGIIETADPAGDRVLDFGPLSGLETRM